jgi:hypothetical protein
MPQTPAYTLEPMKIVASGDGGYDLLARGTDGVIHRFAFLPPGPTARNQHESYSRAVLVSAVVQLRQAVLDLIEYAQPEGYDTDTYEGRAWNNAFVAMAAADGCPTEQSWFPIDDGSAL